jgi:hypothetical protein
MPAVSTTALSPNVTRTQREFVLECVEFFTEAVQLFGVPKSVGHIYGLLYSSPLPLSLSDIVDKLDISKGSASQGLQVLRSLGAINVAGPVGYTSRNFHLPSQNALHAPRSVYYEPELSLRQLIGGILQERLTPLAENSTDRVTRLSNLAKQIGEKNDFYLDRAKRLNTWRRRLKTIMPALSFLLGPKSKK